MLLYKLLYMLLYKLLHMLLYKLLHMLLHMLLPMHPALHAAVNAALLDYIRMPAAAQCCSAVALLTMSCPQNRTHHCIARLWSTCGADKCCAPASRI
jgi:hypothetical protein